MNNDDLASRKERLISEFFGMCAAFNIDNCSMDQLMEELSKESDKKEESKQMKKTYPN